MDAWAALTTESYVAVTCHFISKWKLQSVVLQTKAMLERYTAANLANVLLTAAEHWGLKGKVTLCTCDSASNMVLYCLCVGGGVFE